eukprot:UN24756
MFSGAQDLQSGDLQWFRNSLIPQTPLGTTHCLYKLEKCFCSNLMYIFYSFINQLHCLEEN